MVVRKDVLAPRGGIARRQPWLREPGRSRRQRERLKAGRERVGRLLPPPLGLSERGARLGEGGVGGEPLEARGIPRLDPLLDDPQLLPEQPDLPLPLLDLEAAADPIEPTREQLARGLVGSVPGRRLGDLDAPPAELGVELRLARQPERPLDADVPVVVSAVGGPDATLQPVDAQLGLVLAGDEPVPARLLRRDAVARRLHLHGLLDGLQRGPGRRQVRRITACGHRPRRGARATETEGEDERPQGHSSLPKPSTGTSHHATSGLGITALR